MFLLLITEFYGQTQGLKISVEKQIVESKLKDDQKDQSKSNDKIQLFHDQWNRKSCEMNLIPKNECFIEIGQ